MGLVSARGGCGTQVHDAMRLSAEALRSTGANKRVAELVAADGLGWWDGSWWHLGWQDGAAKHRGRAGGHGTGKVLRLEASGDLQW